MSITSIQIPEPCHQDWDGMQAKEQGRHCGSCQKIVVDFTTWEADDILRYLQKHYNTCGRFKISQIVAPIQAPKINEISHKMSHIFRAPVAVVTRIAAFVLLSFYFVSCGETAKQEQGSAQAPTDTNFIAGGPVTLDSSKVQNQPGKDSGVKLSEPATVKNVDVLRSSHGVNDYQSVIMGAPIAQPEPPICTPTPPSKPEDEVMGDVVFVPNSGDSLTHGNNQQPAKVMQLPTDKRTLVVPEK